MMRVNAAFLWFIALAEMVLITAIGLGTCYLILWLTSRIYESLTL